MSDVGGSYRDGPRPEIRFDKGRDRHEVGAVLEEWLRARTGADVVVGHVDAPEGAGISNETILFDAVVDGVPEALVLRISPDPEQRLRIDALFDEQVRLLRVLGEDGLVRVPKVRWDEVDERWLGRPFFVMDRARGRVPISEPIYNAAGWLHDATPAQQRRAWEAAFDQLLRVHRVPVDRVRFLPGGEGDGTAFERVVKDVRAEYGWACAGIAHPVVDRLWAWLDDNRPGPPPDGLSWGDARIGNMLFDDDFDVAAVLDWELTSVGGSILDLGWWLAFDDVHSASHPRLPGLADRPETIERWEAGTGLRADALEWFEVFAAVRLATLGIRAMTVAGLAPSDDGAFVRFAHRRLGWD